KAVPPGQIPGYSLFILSGRGEDGSWNSEHHSLKILRNRSTVIILIQRVQKIHIFLIDGKIKNIRVGFYAVGMDGFGNYRNSLLHGPAKTYLRRRVGIFRTHYTENVMIQVSASGKRSVSLYLNSVRLTVIDEFLRITQWMAFDLIYGRNDAGNPAEFFKMPDLNVARSA